MSIDDPQSVRKNPFIDPAFDMRQTGAWWIGGFIAVIAFVAAVLLVTGQPAFDRPESTDLNGPSLRAPAVANPLPYRIAPRLNDSNFPPPS